jgi:hypothetical protein
MTLKCQGAVSDVASRDLDPDLALLPIAAISGTFGQVLSRCLGVGHIGAGLARDCSGTCGPCGHKAG